MGAGIEEGFVKGNCPPDLSGVAVRIIAVFFMSANPFSHSLRSVTCVLVAGLMLLTSVPTRAGDEEEAEKTVAQLMHPLEKSGFDFRADVWERDLAPEVGKAVRLQLFKGNDYRICIGVPEKSGVKIEAHVLDVNGEKVEANTDNRGHSVVLSVKPARTGVYVVTIRQTEAGKKKTVTCAMIMGYK